MLTFWRTGIVFIKWKENLKLQQKWLQTTAELSKQPNKL